MMHVPPGVDARRGGRRPADGQFRLDGGGQGGGGGGGGVEGPSVVGMVGVGVMVVSVVVVSGERVGGGDARVDAA